MKKAKEIKQLVKPDAGKVAERMGAKVATIVNKVMQKCNKMLMPIGLGVNIQCDFYVLEKQIKPDEVTNG